METEHKRYLEIMKKIMNFLLSSIWGRIFIFVIIGALIYVITLIASPNNENSSLVSGRFTNNNECSVQGLSLHGSLLTYIPEHAENDSFFDYDVVASEDFVWAIKAINEVGEAKAILIEVDSAGGLPVAGEEISEAIRNSEIPVVAIIRQMGASASYWAISSADKIFASRNSDVGSIGVTMSYLNNVTKNQKDGYTYEQLSAGKYKDSGDPDKALSLEEKAVIMRDINIVHQNFIEDISKNRNIPIEIVKGFADGSTVLGDKAKQLGLIDEIGGLYEAEAYLEEIIGEKPDICWQ